MKGSEYVETGSRNRDKVVGVPAGCRDDRAEGRW